MASPAKFVHLDDLISMHRPIYVRNNKNGIVALTVHDANGRPSSVPIPKTKLPVNLSGKATPYAIQNSRSLRNALSSEHLTLLDPEAAESELQKPGAAQAVKDAESRMGYQSRDVAAHRDQRHSHIEQNDQQANPLEADPHAEIDVAPPEEPLTFDARSTMDDVNSKVTIIVSLVADGEKDVKEAKAELLNMQEDLSNEDLDYIVQHVPAGVLREWAREKLAERRGTQD